MKAGEIEVMVKERRVWAQKQRAASEWLSERVQQAANDQGGSQLVALKNEVLHPRRHTIFALPCIA